MIVLFEYVVVDPLHVFFFCGWVKMGNQATNFCIFVKEEEYLPMKDSNEDIVKWRAKKLKPSNLSVINSEKHFMVYCHWCLNNC